MSTPQAQRPTAPTQARTTGKPQGKPGLVARLRALPARDWLLIAIGAGTLVVAWLAYRRNSSSNTLPNLLTDPAQPVIGGGGGTDNSGGTTAAGQPAVTPSSPIVVDTSGQSGPTWHNPFGHPTTPSNPVNIPLPVAQGVAQGAVQGAGQALIQTDPTYGKVVPPAASVSATATQQNRQNVAPAQPHQTQAVTPSMPILGVLIKRGRQ